MESGGHLVSSEYIDSDENRFKKKREHAFGSERRSEDITGKIGKCRPVRSELEFHHYPCNGTEDEGDGKNFSEKSASFFPSRVLRSPCKGFYCEQKPGYSEA